MSIYVNTNVTSLNTTNKLSKATHSLDTTYKRLSSGYRINSAKDDAAGLQISDRLTSQINGLKQGNRNANDGIALAQTAEGALDEVHTMLQRIRTLSVQSANGTNTTADRVSIQGEVSQLCAEINRIATSASFNGQKLLDGTVTSLNIQVGANATTTADVIQIDSTSLMASSATSLGIASIAVNTFSAAQSAITAIDSALAKVDTARSNLGAIQNRFQSTINNLNNTINNVSAARSRIEDADYAVEVSNMTRAQILQQAGTSVLAQANQVPQTVLSLLR